MARGEFVRTEEYKLKMSNSKKGKVSNFKGKKHKNESKEKIRIYRTGKKRHFKKKENKTNLKDRIRNLFEYRQWRSDIYSRDNYTCQECGDSKGGNLEAHHIKSLYSILKNNNITKLEDAIKCDELWNLNNGITLCLSCHKETDSYLKKI